MPGTTPTTTQQKLPLDSSSSDPPSDSAAIDESNNIEKNEDYQLVSKSLDILKRQLKKATADIETLNQVKSQALQDPYTFIINLKQKSRSNVPKLQKVIAVPEIDWNKYKFLPESRIAQQHDALNDLTQRFISQTKKSTYRNILDTPMATEYTSSPSTMTVKHLHQELAKATQAMRQIPSRANSVSDFSDEEEEAVAVKTTPYQQRRPPNTFGGGGGGGKGIGKRRTSMAQTGKPIDTPRFQSIEPRTSNESTPPPPLENTEDRTPTFKQPWSDQEQQRLQELLEIYPDEPIQAQRFNKISKALGTRTPRQVASRVQKYFIKLAKLGLPVPGRITIPPSCMPKTVNTTKVKKKQQQQQQNGGGRVTKPKTITNRLPYAIPASTGYVRTSGAHYAAAKAPPTVYMSDDEKDVKEMMLKSNTTNDVVIHEGYACDGCGTEPILGVLYKCTMCDVSEEVDLCGNCMEKGTFTNDHHTVDHTFEAVRTANLLPYYADNDYKSPEHALGEYGYLNF